MLSSGTFLGVGFDWGLGDSVFKTFRINSLGLTMPSPIRSTLGRYELGDLGVALDQTEAELEPLLDWAELHGSISFLIWAELDGVLVLTLLGFVRLSGVLSAEALAVDRTALLDGGTIPPPVRLTPPYLGSRDRTFSVGFPILDVAAETILDVDDPNAVAPPTTLPALEGSGPAAGLVRDNAGFTAMGRFFLMLDVVSP
jgi:hypothetical protein